MEAQQNISCCLLLLRPPYRPLPSLGILVTAGHVPSMGMACFVVKTLCKEGMRSLHLNHWKHSEVVSSPPLKNLGSRRNVALSSIQRLSAKEEM